MAMYGTSLIPAPNDAGSVREIERAIKAAYTAFLRTPKGEEAIKEFKMNGMVTGHKVGDNIDAVRALAESAPEEYAILRTTKIKDYRKTQLLDAALRPWQEIGKDGKLTGNPGPKMLKLQHNVDHPAP